MAKLSPDEFRKRLERAIRENGDLATPKDIAEAVEKGTMQSFVNNDSMIVTEVVEFPRGKVLNCVLLVGVMEDCMAMLDGIADFAREHGCMSMRAQGRKGWVRILPNYGWKQKPVVTFERAL